MHDTNERGTLLVLPVLVCDSLEKKRDSASVSVVSLTLEKRVDEKQEVDDDASTQEMRELPDKVCKCQHHPSQQSIPLHKRSNTPNHVAQPSSPFAVSLFRKAKRRPSKIKSATRRTKKRWYVAAKRIVGTSPFPAHGLVFCVDSLGVSGDEPCAQPQASPSQQQERRRRRNRQRDAVRHYALDDLGAIRCLPLASWPDDDVHDLQPAGKCHWSHVW